MIQDISKIENKDVKILVGKHKDKVAKVVEVDKDPINERDRILVEKEGVGGAVKEINKLTPNSRKEMCCPGCRLPIMKIYKNRRYYYSPMLGEVE